MSDKPTLYIDRDHLKAALRVAPKRHIRYFLNGVFIQADATQTIMVATDGHMLLVLRKPTENSLAKPVELIMSREVCENVLRLNIKLLSSIDLIQDASGSWSAPLSNLDMGNRLSFNPVEAKYPDYRKVIPEKVSGEAGTFNPQFLVAMKGVANDINSGTFELLQNGPTDAAVIPFDADMNCFGVVMPMRGGVSPEAWHVPEFARTPPEKKVKKTKKEAVAA